MRTATRHGTCPTARGRSAPSPSARRSRASSGRRPSSPSRRTPRRRTRSGRSWNGRPSRLAFVLDPTVFKAYDVRGLYGDELDEEGAYAIGRAYVEQFSPRTIAVGRDMRVSGPSMAAAVREGAAEGG